MYQKTVLENGLTVVSEQISEFRSCSLGIWAGAGSRYETEEQSGISHVLEHLLFKGTTSRSAYDIAVTMDGVGGQLNAFTEKEHTCYYARVMDKHVPMALDILADMVMNSLLDEEELEREKGVILEEIKMYEDTPDDQIFDLFNRAFYRGHPLGRPIIGTAAVVRSIKREHLTEYMESRYRASNLLVAAAGPLEHAEFVGLVDKHLGRHVTRGAAERRLTTPTPEHSVSIFNKDCEQAYFCLAAPGLSHVDERRYVMLTLDSVLGGSMSSRLFQEIREKRGLAYSVGTFQNSYFDCGLFGVYAGTSPEKVEEVLALTRQILREASQTGLAEHEVARAREHLKGSIALGLESTSNRMMRMARNFFYHGRFVPIEEVIEKIDAVTGADIRELATWLLDPDRYSLAVIGPVQEIDGVAARPLPSQEPAAAVRAAWHE